MLLSNWKSPRNSVTHAVQPEGQYLWQTGTDHRISSLENCPLCTVVFAFETFDALSMKIFFTGMHRHQSMRDGDKSSY